MRPNWGGDREHRPVSANWRLGPASGEGRVQAIADILGERRLSLRGLAAASGVNRQSIADLFAGRSWPDAAAVA
ncbi:hypothetical protein ACIA8R_31915 [Nonomuraea sp. NPDC051191]|uniref:hypothetical protein n=1 Tax=Nonomuraea sp. NPDC051191 TaxID=3364372 RepID=UPI0037B09ECF